jgi:hypothetical protein
MDVRQVVPRDAIPSVDDPTFTDEYFGDPDDDVIVLVQGSEARAYPLRVLDYHEIVNDSVGDLPVAVTWCPLCGSAVVYDRRVDERVLTFGVSGKLADDDLVMYDRETDSEWKQSLGEAIGGPLEGTELDVVPAQVTTWERFRTDHQEGQVLARPGGDSEAAGDSAEPEPIDYDDEPYDEYFERDGFGLAAHRGDGSREWDRDDVDPKTVVLGVEPGDEALGFPLPTVEEAGGVVTADAGGTPVVVFATADGIHAFRDPGFDWEPAGDGRFRADGTTWGGATGQAGDGRSLDRLPARRLFAFAWQDDHGAAAFYG